MSVAQLTPAPHTLDPERIGDHLDRLYRAALGLCGSSHDAEDLVQETCLRILRKPRTVNGDDAGYLLGVMRNTFVSGRRSAARRPRSADGIEDLDAFAHTSCASPHQAAESHEVLAAVAALPAPFRDAVVAVDLTGLSCGEAARALGVAPGTIMSRLFRARRKLAAAIEPEPAELEPLAA